MLSLISREPQPAVQVHMLGTFRVQVSGRVVSEDAWRRTKSRQLFKCLLSQPSRRMTRDEIIELLWPDSDATSSTNLRTALHWLRKALEDPSGNALGVAFMDSGSVWLRPDVELWIDADSFERLASESRRATDPLPLLEQADALYAGDYLPDDPFEDWSVGRRESLRRTWTELQFQLAQEYERRGDLDAATRPLHRLLDRDTSDERAARELIRLLARQGRRTDALRVYQRLEESLREQLDVEPSDATQALQREVLAGETDSGATAGEFRCTYPFPSPSELFGREIELSLLDRVMVRGRSAGQAVLVGAPAGTGKSALLGRIVQRAHATGMLCLAGGCYEDGGMVPLGPFHDALADYLLAQTPEQLQADVGALAPDLATVIPELRYHLDMAGAPAETARGDRMRVFGAVHALLRKLTERGPTLLCIEDLHAADEPTLHLFHYLARQTRRQPLILIATYRSDEAPAGGPLAQMLAAVVRERLAEDVRPAGLTPRDSIRLASTLLEAPISEQLADSLYATTGGNPLFIEQLVLALREAGHLVLRGGAWYADDALQGAPQIVREVIAQRLVRLSTTCRATLEMAAVLGPTVEHNVLLAVVEPPSEQALLLDLDQAFGAAVLRETVNGYAFGHALLRDAVYYALTPPRRMLLHARAAEVLERLRGDRADDYAAELAHHFTRAGESPTVRSRALHYSLQAGRRAAQASAYPEALNHFTRASALLERENASDAGGLRLEALEGRGWAEVELARWAETAETFRQVLDLSTDPVHRARARGVIAFTLGHTGETARVIEECTAGLAELEGRHGAEVLSARMQLHQMIALVRYLQGHYRDVMQIGMHLQTELRDDQSLRARVFAHMVTAWGHMGLGQVDAALREYDRSLDAANQIGEKVQVATCYENIGFQNYLAGRFEEAHDVLETALAMYRDSANQLRGVNAQHHLCRVLVAEANYPRALQLTQQILEIEMAGGERFAADGHHTLGVIALHRADWTTAATHLKRALSIRKQVGDAAGTIESLVALGLVHQGTGDWAAAADLFSEANHLADSMDAGPWAIHARRHLGRLLLLRGERDLALPLIESAASMAAEVPETLEYAPTLLVLGELRADENEMAGAVSLSQQALERAAPIEHVAQAHLQLAMLHLRAGALDAAAPHAAEALALAVRLESPPLMSRAYVAMGLSVASADAAVAADHFRLALQYARSAQAPYERAIALVGCAEHLHHVGSLDAADEMKAEALGIFESLGATREMPRESISSC